MPEWTTVLKPFVQWDGMLKTEYNIVLLTLGDRLKASEDS